MKDFIRINIKTKLKQKEIYEILSRSLVEFAWKMGDSDMQGLYITGMDKNKVQIQLWLDDNTADLSVSYRSAVDDPGTREKFITDELHNVLKLIGDLVEITGIN